MKVNSKVKKISSQLFDGIFATCIFLSVSTVNAQEKDMLKAKPNAGLILPAGFSAVMLAENVGRARHLVVTPQADIYVRLAKPVNGNGTVVLHEANGKATLKYGFGNYGGTGIAVKNGYLYASSNQEVFRYKLDDKNQVTNKDNPDKIITGLIERGQHETKSIVLDNDGNIYVNIGAYMNSCQVQDRAKGSMGRQPCEVLDSAGGIWMFKSNALNQSYPEGVKYATGLRNVVGLDWNQQLNQLFVMQHGRDQLHDIFPDMFTTQQSAELPAECMFALKKGDNAGWPYTYYDPFQNKKILAPEYGGDGKKEGSSEYIDPAAAFPAHLAPNGLVFYTGNSFPAKYKNGAFIAFHGSWNRAPEPQAGYYVVFQPFVNGKPSGKWEVFANNFSGSPEKTASGRAEHRPCGLAVGPDGSIYVSDDSKGAIYKISYGNKKTADKAASKNKSTLPAEALKSKTTDGKATASNAAKPATISLSASIAAGKAVYAQYCLSCHQADGGGVQNMNPPLYNTSYVKGDKSRLISVLLKGLSRQSIDDETYTNVMAPYNFLSDSQVANVLTYIRNSFHNKAGIISPADVKAVRAKG